MTAIRDIFDANTLELHDLRADPNTVIKIQSLVREMVETNENRRLGIVQHLLEEYGTFALPGIISATYVLSDQLANRRNREILVELMSTLCRGSAPAQRLLLRFGIAENPFDTSREIAAQALDQVGDLEINPADVDWLLAETRRLVREEERSAVNAIFHLLLSRSIGYAEALEICYRWLAGDMEVTAPAKLMNLLLKTHSTQTEAILTRLFDALERRDDEAGRIIKASVDLGDATAIIPAMRAASKRLDKERMGRAKPVEHLFEGAIARQIIQTPGCISACAEFVQSERLNVGVTRYWWQALSAAAKMNCEDAKRYFDQALPQFTDESYALWGYVQLLFIETGPRVDKQTKAWAAQTLQDLGMQNPYLHQQASEIKERIVSGERVAGKERRQYGKTIIS